MNSTPTDFQKAINAAGLNKFFAECTDAHRREYLKWIDAAKQPGTRLRRIEKAVEMIREKQAEEQARPQR